MTEPAIPQRLTIVTPTTAEFHSGTYRIASSATARGHEVNVVARWAPGLAIEERHPAGYRVIRIASDPREGLLMPAGMRDQVRRRAASRAADREADRAAVGGAASPGQRGPVGRLSHGLGRVLALRADRFEAARIVPPADIVLAYHYLGIGTGLALGRRDDVPVIYDAGDIYLASTAVQALPRPARLAIARYERSAAHRAASVVTANEGYADELARRLDVPQPVVVLNCPPRRAMAADASDPRPRRFHEALGLDPAERVVLYHGGFTAERGIEELIEAIPQVGRAVLVLLGFGPLAARYQEVAADPATGGRVRVMPAVPPAELIEWVASADVAAMTILPTTLNHRLSTPNKLFEAIAAGVPVVASDLPGMAPIVRLVDAGQLVDPDDPASIAAGVRALLAAGPDEQAARRARLLAAARETYNWEVQSAHLFAEFGQLTHRPW
jgi:glycosyltransferase involved in cell wall biosynthesis